MRESEAIAYLAAPDGAPWSWASDGSALVWQDGATVALREEVLAVLEAQSLHAWPPFEAFVLMLAACRGRVFREEELLRASQGNRAADLGALLAPGTADAFERACGALERIAALPMTLRRGLGVKRQLAGLLCEAGMPADEATVARQRSILKALGDQRVNEWSAAVARRDPMRALAALAEAFATPDEAALARRLRTGLDGGVGPAPLLARPAAQVRALLQQLALQPEQAGLARAARDVLAALRLPRRVARSEEFSTTGAADIANQGPLDRLLLSELAHDDDVLAARLALREALYVRREPPATPPAGAFVVLLDLGIRSWGLPRIFGVAVALALAALDERRVQFAAYRATGAEQGGAVPVDLFSTPGLESLLTALEPAAHPGEALRAFFAAPQFAVGAGQPAPEAVIVLTPQAAADPDFQRALEQVTRLPESLYFATVARDGSFALTLYPTSGRTPVSSAQIELSALTNEPPRPLADESGLPAFLRLQPVPLLLSVRAGLKYLLQLRDGRVCAVTERRELVGWDPGKSHGARRLAHHLPGGRVLLLREEPDGRILCVTNTREDGCVPLVWIRPDEESVERLGVEQRSPPLAVSGSNDESILFFHYPTRIEAVDLQTGQVRDSRNLSEGLRPEEGKALPLGTNPCLSRCGPRYYRNPRQLVAAAWDDRLVWIPFQEERVDFMAVFQRPGSGVWGLTFAGEFGEFLEGRFVAREQWPVKASGSFGDLSPDGTLLWLDGGSKAPGGTFYQVSKQGEVTHRWFRGTDPGVGFALGVTVPQRQVRTRFSAIGITTSHRLALECVGGGWLLLEREPGAGLIGVHRGKNALELIVSREFTMVKRPKQAADSQQAVTWPDGSQSFLDARGLLHLRSSTADLPEMTITLGDGQCGIWCSDGRVAGPPFHLGPQSPNLAVDEIMRRLETFVLRAMRLRK